MPIILNIDDFKFNVKPEQQGQLDALKQKYNKRLCQDRKELADVCREFDKELSDLTGQHIMKTNGYLPTRG